MMTTLSSNLNLGAYLAGLWEGVEGGKKDNIFYEIKNYLKIKV